MSYNISQNNTDSYSVTGNDVKYTVTENEINYAPDQGNESSLTLDEESTMTWYDNVSKLKVSQDTSTTTPWWVSFWAKIENVNGGHLYKQHEYEVFWLRNSTIGFRLGNSILEVRTTVVVPALAGAWHHYIFYYDGTQASSGMEIYIDKVASKFTDNLPGPWNSVTTTNLAPYMEKLVDNGASEYEIIDFRMGNVALTEQDRTDLYDFGITGKETLQIPMSEGSGDYLHNVTTKDDPSIYPFIENDVNAAMWSNTQDKWRYNWSYGYSVIDSLIIPNLNTGATYLQSRWLVGLHGQSNATPKGDVDDLLGTDYADAHDPNNYNEDVFCYDVASGDWFPQKRTFPNQFSSLFCMDVSLGYKFKAAGKKICILRYASGSTGLYLDPESQDWNVASVGELLDNMKAFYNNGIKKLWRVYGVKAYIISYLWQQGEDDATLTKSVVYRDNMDDFFEDIEEFIYSDIDVQIGQLSDAGAYDTEAGDNIRTAQSGFVNDNDNADLIDTSDATFNDTVHYDGDFMITMGERYYDNIKDITTTNSFTDGLYPNGDGLIEYTGNLF